MNYLIINGYVQSRKNYLVGENGQNEFRFFISATSLTLDESFPVPVKCLGKLADEAQCQINEGYYVEVLGELIRISAKECYVLARELKFIPPKSKTAYYMKSSEFLELFSPSKILERYLEKDKEKTKETALKYQEEKEALEDENEN